MADAQVKELLKKGLEVMQDGQRYSKRGVCTDELSRVVTPDDPKAVRFDPVGVLEAVGGMGTVRNAALRLLVSTLQANADYSKWSMLEFGMHRPRDLVVKLYEAAIAGNPF